MESGPSVAQESVRGDQSLICFNPSIELRRPPYPPFPTSNHTMASRRSAFGALALTMS